MSFLHGVETVEFQQGPSKIETIASAVIGLVGSAPIQTVAVGDRTVNTPVLITNDKDAAKFFGADTAGYTIPSALKAILAQGAGPVVVVNVFDPISVAHQTAGVPDPTKVVAGDIIGTTNADGTRTGLKALKDAKPTYGFAPKQIIAPGFTTLTGVMTEMDSIAAALRAIAWVDATVAMSPTQAISARATTLNSASKRVMICYPSVKALGPDGVTAVLQPLSQFAAGACAARDQQKGYWWSPSGMELKGTVGLERPIDGSFQDANAELNLLNASAITTVYVGFGTGYRLWGNRSAAWPANNDPDSFLAVRRTADVIEESLEYACLKYVDNPITKALVDQILDDANSFIRALIGRGAVVDCKAFYDPAKNTSDQLAGGHLTLGYRFMPPAPLERLSFEAYLDVNLYANAMK